MIFFLNIFLQLGVKLLRWTVFSLGFFWGGGCPIFEKYLNVAKLCQLWCLGNPCKYLSWLADWVFRQVVRFRWTGLVFALGPRKTSHVPRPAKHQSLLFKLHQASAKSPGQKWCKVTRWLKDSEQSATFDDFTILSPRFAVIFLVKYCTDFEPSFQHSYTCSLLSPK